MSAKLSGELTTLSSDSAIHRIDSGDTVESPFGSNLATPNDDDIHGYPGIVERLATAKELNTYFLPGDIEITTATDELERKIEEEIRPSNSEAVDIVSQQNSPISSLDSTQSLFSPDFSSPETHWTGLQPTAPTSSLYSLPNSHIIVEKIKEPVETLHDFSKDPGAAGNDYSDQSGFFVPGKLVAHCSRILFFLPWCIAVGAAIILSPSNLDHVAVSSGYVDALDGIHRFSYWAEYGYPHVMSFLAFLGLQAWLFPTIGSLVIGGALGQFVYAWHSFLPDYSIPLGSDDFQMVYHLATSFWFCDAPFGIRKVESRFYADSAGGHLPMLQLEADSDNE